MPEDTRRPSRVIAKHDRRRRLLAVQDFCDSIAFRNSKVKARYTKGMEDGTLPVPLERAVLEIAYGRPGQIDQRLLDTLGTAGAGLIHLLLRKPLTEDPLADAKQAGGRVLEHAPQEPALPALNAAQLESVIPPSRPRKPKSTAQPLRPGEEVLP